MRLSAVNLVSFRANDYDGYCDCPKCCSEFYTQDALADYNLNPQTLKDQYIKERDDISPFTGIFMVATGALALKAGNKGVAYVRRGAAYALESISKSFAGLASKIRKEFDIEEATRKIEKTFAGIKDDRRANDEKITRRFTDAVNAILSPKDENGTYLVNKGENIVKTLNKFGIYLRPTSLFDHGVALGLIALPTMSEAGKRLESDMDKKQFHEGTMKQNSIYEKVAMQVVKEALSEGI